jgi:hypothetical protein
LNAVSAHHFVDTAHLGRKFAFASNRLGGGMQCNALELFLLERMAAVGGWIDPAPWVAELGPNLPEDQAARLHGLMLKLFEDRLAAWQLAGLA